MLDLPDSIPRVEFIAVNTIGLTGAEMIAAELARYPDVLMLPGQNFIGFGTTTYRPHDYTGWAPADIFANLGKLHRTRQGRVWSGLTKAMTPEQLERYDEAAHLAEFTTPRRHRHHHDRPLAELRHLVRPRRRRHHRLRPVRVLRLQHGAHRRPLPRLPRALDDGRLHGADRLLARQHRAAGGLGLARGDAVLARQHADRAQVGAAAPRALPARRPARVPGRPGRRARAAGRAPGAHRRAGRPSPGFVAYAPEVVDATDEIAADLFALYRGHAEFDLAKRFDEWADEFLGQPGSDELLDRFESWWTTTSHTNLDWVGPVGDRIVDAVVAWSGATSAYSPGRWFYHECFSLNSDNWETARGDLEHYLGDLEDEIVLPATAAQVRIVLLYLENVADNITKRAYSATPVRETSLYRRMRALEPNFAKWALVDRVAAVEEKIDEADAAMATFF